MSYILGTGTVSEVSARIRIGASAGIHFAIGWIARQVRGQLAARRIDGGLHVARGGIDVAVQIELQRDAGRAQLARRCHLVDAGDAAELPLQRSRHRRCHGLRARARQACADADHGKLHLGQRSDRQKIEGQDPRQQQRRRQQRRANRTVDKWSGDIHRLVRRPRLRGIGLPILYCSNLLRQPVKPQIHHRRGVERE